MVMALFLLTVHMLHIQYLVNIGLSRFSKNSTKL